MENFEALLRYRKAGDQLTDAQKNHLLILAFGFIGEMLPVAVIGLRTGHVSLNDQRWLWSEFERFNDATWVAPALEEMQDAFPDILESLRSLLDPEWGNQ